MEYFFSVLGMVMFIEGLPYLACPDMFKTWILKIAELPSSTLRRFGFLLMTTGLLVIYWAK